MEGDYVVQGWNRFDGNASTVAPDSEQNVLQLVSFRLTRSRLHFPVSDGAAYAALPLLWAEKGYRPAWAEDPFSLRNRGFYPDRDSRISDGQDFCLHYLARLEGWKVSLINEQAGILAGLWNRRYLHFS
jgi:hypothetical protein